MSLHKRLELREWLRARFPERESKGPLGIEVDQLFAELLPINGLVSPLDVFYREVVLEKGQKQFELGCSQELDLVLWSVEKQSLGPLTRLGGTPHREASLPWPESADGTPHVFIAQFCFADSKDLFDVTLPGDVLLVFFKDEESFFGDDEDIYFEWSTVELERPLDSTPEKACGWTRPTMSSYLYRTLDYPKSERFFESIGIEKYWNIPIAFGSRIGPSEYFANLAKVETKNDGCVLCVLDSLSVGKRPWPFVDLESAADLFEAGTYFLDPWGSFAMLFGDTLSLVFILDSDKQVSWRLVQM